MGRCIISVLLISFCMTRVLSQTIEANDNRERNFAFEVKQIDEFFERFNNVEKGLLDNYVDAHYKDFTIDRPSLVRSLFNRENKDWKPNDLEDFFSQVTDSLHPVMLDFYSSDWYAETICRALYKGRKIDVTIILRIQQDTNGGSRWLIKDAYSDKIKPVSDPVRVTTNNPSKKFLNPISHATNFIGLARALHDKTNIRDYLDSTFMDHAGSRAFLRALLKNELEYQFVRSIRYHFLQVDGWIFTVDDIRRNSVNAGWLINSLSRASEEEKTAYRRALYR